MRQYMHAKRCIDTKSISTSRRIRIRDGRMSHSSARMLPHQTHPRSIPPSLLRGPRTKPPPCQTARRPESIPTS